MSPLISYTPPPRIKKNFLKKNVVAFIKQESYYLLFKFIEAIRQTTHK